MKIEKIYCDRCGRLINDIKQSCRCESTIIYSDGKAQIFKREIICTKCQLILEGYFNIKKHYVSKKDSGQSKEQKLARAIHDFSTLYNLVIQNNAVGLYVINKILTAGFVDADEFYNTARETPEGEIPNCFDKRI